MLSVLTNTRSGPKNGVRSVPGDLNGTYWGGTSTQDTHHYRTKGANVFSVSGRMPEDVAKNLIRTFAQSYSGRWSWPFGKNCHSFQEALIREYGFTIKKKE